MTAPTPEAVRGAVTVLAAHRDALAVRLAEWAAIEDARRRWEADVLLARDAGMSVREIARLAGCTASRVQRLIEAPRP